MRGLLTIVPRWKLVVSAILVGWACIFCMGATRRDSAVVRAQREWVRAHPRCVVCTLRGRVFQANEGHHIYPHATYPEHRFGPFVTLCRGCHFLVGHQCNWQNQDTNVLARVRAVRVAAGVEKGE